MYVAFLHSHLCYVLRIPHSCTLQIMFNSITKLTLSCLWLLMPPTCELPNQSVTMLPLQALKARRRHAEMPGRRKGRSFGRGLLS